jgi:hypothetical protein
LNEVDLVFDRSDFEPLTLEVEVRHGAVVEYLQIEIGAAPGSVASGRDR